MEVEGEETEIPDIPACTWKGYFDGSHYFFNNDGNFSWIAANSAAVNQGGHLLTISSQEEDDFIFSLFLIFSGSNEYFFRYFTLSLI